MKQEYIDSIKNAVSKNFYDKTLNIYNVSEVVGEELDVVRVKGNLKQELQCNVHIIGDKLLKQDYGLNVEANIMITCSSTMAVKGDIVTYSGKDYRIVELIENDSHVKIFGDSNG